jgi:uncharacterized protein YoxC
MLFSNELLSSLRDDPVQGVIEVCRIVTESLEEDPEGWSDADYKTLLEGYALLTEIIDAGLLLPNMILNVSVTGDRNSDCSGLYSLINALAAECISQTAKMKFASLKTHFKISLGSAFHYEFSQGDLTKVQELINEIRTLISAATALEKEHQQRLLRRVEKLQSEMHKKVSDLDRFWGLVGDAGVVLGKLGEDAKPIVDRVKEVAEIVWRTQARAEELPSGTKIPLLGTKADTIDH